MASIKGYLMLSVGSTILFGGMFASLNSIGEMRLVLTWAAVAMVGMFVLAFGTKHVLLNRGGTNAVDPKKAPGKTE